MHSPAIIDVGTLIHHLLVVLSDFGVTCWSLYLGCEHVRISWMKTVVLGGVLEVCQSCILRTVAGVITVALCFRNPVCKQNEEFLQIP